MGRGDACNAKTRLQHHALFPEPSGLLEYILHKIVLENWLVAAKRS